ncbi:MAG: MoaD/ThiS family protein [Anaerolineales bacterium]|nr:MoaD/ThiS family protein [Anaerolineales bacterium]
MQIYLGGHLNFYHSRKENWLEVKLEQPTLLKDIIDGLDIPLGEVYLVVVNDEIADLQETIIAEQDEVKLFSAVGGG